MTTYAKQKSGKAVPKATNKRIRLSPEVRQQQILDAALIEFSSLGFAAASISRIARRAGTSKANLYVHFANKDEIFETLLKNVLVPPKASWDQLQPDQSLEELIDLFIDESYSGLTPSVIAIVRLLIAESHRVPGLIRRWHEESVVPVHSEQQHTIDQYVAAGQLQRSPLTDHFSFVMAPVLYAAIYQMVFCQDADDEELHKIKETHRKILHLLLKKQ